MRKIATFMLFILVLQLSACNNSLPEGMPDLGMNGDDLELNTDIRLTTPKECNTFQSGKPICLEITNLSEKEWSINKRKDILIFQYESKEWKKISDNMIHLGNMDTILGPTGIFPNDQDVVSVLPEVEGSKSIYLRIFIIVHEQSLEKEGQNKGAFVDVSLKP